MSFEEFPKIPRFSRGCTVTEKIDGTNAQVHIASADDYAAPVGSVIATMERSEGVPPLVMLAGSRNRYITPAADNFGFAAWVKANAEALWGLGEGRHFGEWWGSGVQRGYGLAKGEKRFSLFNVGRWADRHSGDLTFTGDGQVGAVPSGKQAWAPECCRVVPVLYEGPFGDAAIDAALASLRASGSMAAPGFMQPEGVVAFHHASRSLFKKTLEKDEEPKGKVA